MYNYLPAEQNAVNCIANSSNNLSLENIMRHNVYTISSRGGTINESGYHLKGHFIRYFSWNSTPPIHSESYRDIYDGHGE